jgi:hypothetical protein
MWASSSRSYDYRDPKLFASHSQLVCPECRLLADHRLSESAFIDGPIIHCCFAFSHQRQNVSKIDPVGVDVIAWWIGLDLYVVKSRRRIGEAQRRERGLDACDSKTRSAFFIFRSPIRHIGLAIFPSETSNEFDYTRVFHFRSLTHLVIHNLKASPFHAGF